MAGKSGAARIALRTGAPVLPIAQWGCQEVWGKDMKKPKFFPRKTLKITAGPTMDLKALVGPATTKDALEQATVLIMDRITGLLGEIRGEQPPAVRFVPVPKAEVASGKADAKSTDADSTDADSTDVGSSTETAQP